jgi:hypothetical protein
MNFEWVYDERIRKFELVIHLSPEYGGDVDEIPAHILNHETMNDHDLRDKLIAKEVPTVDTIYR